MSGLSVGNSNTLGKIIGRNIIPSGMSVGYSFTFGKNNGGDSIVSGVSVPYRSLLAKIEEDSPSMSGLSVVNPNPFPKNKDRIERQTRARALCKTMGLNLGVSQRWQHWQPMNRGLF